MFTPGVEAVTPDSWARLSASSPGRTKFVESERRESNPQSLAGTASLMPRVCHSTTLGERAGRDTSIRSTGVRPGTNDRLRRLRRGLGFCCLGSPHGAASVLHETQEDPQELRASLALRLLEIVVSGGGRHDGESLSGCTGSVKGFLRLAAISSYVALHRDFAGRRWRAHRGIRLVAMTLRAGRPSTAGASERVRAGGVAAGRAGSGP